MSKTSRLETGTFQLTPKSQDIFPVVKDALIQIEKKAEKKGIQVLLDESEIPVVAFCDKKWTVEAVYNILDNAVKYSMEGTEIQIQVKNFEFFVGIEICDKGMGISEEEIPFIFQRFYRGKMVKEEEGVGIGLYLSRQIIEGQNGYIKVASKEGEGSVFSVFLPAGK